MSDRNLERAGLTHILRAEVVIQANDGPALEGGARAAKLDIAEVPTAAESALAMVRQTHPFLQRAFLPRAYDTWGSGRMRALTFIMFAFTSRPHALSFGKLL